MAGWLFNPYGPETRAVKGVYLVLVEFSDAIDSENINWHLPYWSSFSL